MVHLPLTFPEELEVDSAENIIVGINICLSYFSVERALIMSCPFYVNFYRELDSSSLFVPYCPYGTYIISFLNSHFIF